MVKKTQLYPWMKTYDSKIVDEINSLPCNSAHDARKGN